MLRTCEGAASSTTLPRSSGRGRSRYHSAANLLEFFPRPSDWSSFHTAITMLLFACGCRTPFGIARLCCRPISDT